MNPIHQLPGSAPLSGLLFGNTTSPVSSRKVNLSAAVDPTVNDDSSGGYGVGSYWINIVSGKVFFATSVSVGAANWTSGSSGSSSKETITFANSFVAGDIIRRTAGGYVLAQADSISDAEVLGVVETASGSDFTIVYFGKISLTAHGFTVGAALFLSASSAGILTSTEPSTTGQVSKPVALVLDADNLLIINFRGLVIGAANVGFLATVLSNVNVALTWITSVILQKYSGTLSGPVVVNISRANAVSGAKFEVNLAGVVCDPTNTLTFQENGSGSMTSFTGTVTGKMEFAFNGTSWEIFSQSTIEA